jgi:hypothetical protein
MRVDRCDYQVRPRLLLAVQPARDKCGEIPDKTRNMLEAITAFRVFLMAILPCMCQAPLQQGHLPPAG